MKLEKMEQDLREKVLESQIASTKIRDLQSSQTGLPERRRESTNLKPLNPNPADKMRTKSTE